MPFYRLGIGIVHMKGSKLPAPCAARVLIEGKEAACLAPSGFLCDGPSKSGKGTCDAAMCERHATQVGPNSHLCPSCRTEAVDEIGQRNLFTHLVQP
ncbi:hypothetical protein [Pseudacidovorax intermedius]|uniref:Uncharacterized protein n=1 Tax=Pseudacidovorax intermedius TaxID=433924 RepID=A0A147GWB2_9BURK|nr:hypothetical protein [Pseudacidovorax intermedius]KTT21874.1 hypothetical protein NS331_10945 [Pseudacidovorax intermedius]